MKKQLILVLSISIFAILSSKAQVKVGSNPATISTNANLEVEATNGKKVRVTKDNGTLIVENVPSASGADSVMLQSSTGLVSQMSVTRFVDLMRTNGLGLPAGGTAGQVLTQNANGTPTWQNASSNSLTPTGIAAEAAWVAGIGAVEVLSSTSTTFSNIYNKPDNSGQWYIYANPEFTNANGLWNITDNSAEVTIDGVPVKFNTPFIVYDGNGDPQYKRWTIKADPGCLIKVNSNVTFTNIYGGNLDVNLKWIKL